MSSHQSGRIRNPVLFICDIQEKFRPAIAHYEHLLNTTRKLLRFAELTEIPIFITTQQRAKLGNTCEELELDGRYKGLIKADVDKTAFSMCVPEILYALKELDKDATGGRKRDVVIVGIETHICVSQTTIDLLGSGHRVYVVTDGVSSCNAEERGIALERLRKEGARVTTSESLMYEILIDAKDERFKSLAGLVKESKTQTKEAVGALCRI